VNAAVQAAESRCAELAKLEASIGLRCDSAARKLAEAEADERKHAEKLAAAEETYASEPTEKHADAIGKARDALRLAELRVRTPRAEHEAAQAELASWRADVAAAHAATHRAELQHRASLDEYNRRTATSFKTLLAALAAVRNAAADIDHAFDEANAAARELGEPELSVFHRVTPLLRSAAAVHGADGLLNRGNFYKAASTCSSGLVRAIPLPLLDAIEVHARDRGVLRNATNGLLERVLACRTGGEGDELIKEAEKHAAAVTPEPQPADAPPKAAAPPKPVKAAGFVDTLDDVASLFS
jgi:hypothetical protein